MRNVHSFLTYPRVLKYKLFEVTDKTGVTEEKGGECPE